MIRKIYRKLYAIIIGKIDPIKYAKKIGVNFSGEVHIYGHVHWGTEPWIITLGDNVHITNGVNFITHDGGTLLFRGEIPDLEITAPIVIGNDVYIGNNVTLLPGVTVGNRVVIGASAIITKDIPDNSVVVGVPARVVETVDEYLEKIKKKSVHLGHLKGQEKDKALMKHFGYQGMSKGIYF